MADDLSALESWAAPLLAKISPAEQRTLARKIGQALRRSQAKRIAAQLNPDGSAYEPRKTTQKSSRARQHKGKIRRTMFERLRRARTFKVRADEEGVSVGFTGYAAFVARVHQEGLRDKVKRNGPIYQYPARELLGFTDAEREMVQDLLLQHLAG